MPLVFAPLVATLVLTACGDSKVHATQNRAEEPRVIEDISYIDGGKSDAHTLDLYLPANTEGRAPVIIWIHGGAWIGGDKKPAPIARFLANGYAAASINYRLSNESKFPAQIHDCKAAIRWVRANAAKYNLDPERIGAFGMSAGGHLSALLGTTNGVKEVEGSLGDLSKSSDVQAVVDWCGPSNMLTIRKQAGPDSQLDFDSSDSPVRRLLGGKPEKRKEAARLASPVSFVSKDDPPFLIMHGDRDTVVPLAQSVELNEALKKAGAAVDFKIVKGGEHSFLSADTMQDVVDFFDKNLKSPLKATGTSPETRH